MDRLDINEIRLFYEKVPEVWPENESWYLYTINEINRYITIHSFNNNSYILNAGSGGNTYGLLNKMLHVDIAENKINLFPEYCVANIEVLPTQYSRAFTDAICVGTVINYCDAYKAISELYRILVNNGKLIIEFESSWGLEYRKNKGYKQSATIIETTYYGKQHKQWIYSPNYIKSIMQNIGFKIVRTHRFHYLSGLYYNKHHNENNAVKYAKYDSICRYVPFLYQYSNNIIYTCIKL